MRRSTGPLDRLAFLVRAQLQAREEPFRQAWRAAAVQLLQARLALQEEMQRAAWALQEETPAELWARVAAEEEAKLVLPAPPAAAVLPELQAPTRGRARRE